MTRAWRVVLAAVVAGLAVAVPVPAGARPLLEEADAIELANKLADATEEQDVCYGWSVQVQDDDGNLSGFEQGSSLGPGLSPYAAGCTPYVVFTAFVHYTSELSESADSASYGVESNLEGFDPDDVGGLGISDDQLLGSNDDLAVANATALLPALVAEQGLAPAVPIEETAGTIPATDRPTNTPGSDTWRTHWPLFALTGLLLVAGVGWIAGAFAVRSVQRHNPDFAISSLFDDD